MTPQQLKNSILQRAIEGKLVEQRPEEGTAKELLKEIKLEKEKLVKEGKIKKSKPLPPITEDEMPFDIPDNWEWVRLGEIVFFTSGKQYVEIESGIPYIKVADMNLLENQNEIVTSSRFVAPNNIGQITPYSIIFPKRGGAIATNKKRIVRQQPIFIDSNSMGITAYQKDIFNYLKVWFDTVDLGKLQTGTSVPQINNKELSPLLFPLPPLSEQHRIVAKIEELMPLCDKLSQAN